MLYQVRCVRSDGTSTHSRCPTLPDATAIDQRHRVAHQLARGEWATTARNEE